MKTSYVATLVLSLASLAAGQVMAMAMAPDLAAAQGRTRAQVQAELADAVRTGDIRAWDRQGRKLNELYPSRYAGKSVAVVSEESAQTAANDASSYDPLQIQGMFSGGN